VVSKELVFCLIIFSLKEKSHPSFAKNRKERFQPQKEIIEFHTSNTFPFLCPFLIKNEQQCQLGGWRESHTIRE
jgi:hypothetical protein